MKILVMCTANSCRSQMAEAWARHLFPADWTIESAGLVTSPISEKTRRAMADVGLGMGGQYSKSIDDFDLGEFDWILTFSRHAGDLLPRLPDRVNHLRCPVHDPTGTPGHPDVVAAAYAEARDRIRRVLETFLAEHSG